MTEHDPVSLGSPTFRTLDRGPVQLTSAWFPAQLTLPRHTHDRCVVAITLGGRWDSTIGARRYTSHPGHILVEPAAEGHSNYFGDRPTRLMVIQPDPSRDDLWHPCRRVLDGVHHFADPVVARLARRLASELDRGDDLAALSAEGLSLEILACAAAPSRTASAKGSPWLARTLDYLHEHFLDCPSIPTLAAIAGVHPSQLTRVFNAQYGCSPATYLRQLRLRWAARELRAGVQEVAEIAAMAGFADQSHFTRAFHRFAGVTPSRYRASARPHVG